MERTICPVTLCRMSTTRGGYDSGPGLQRGRRELEDQRQGSQRPAQAEVLSESWVGPLGSLEMSVFGMCQGKQKGRLSQAKIGLMAAGWGRDTCPGYYFPKIPSSFEWPRKPALYLSSIFPHPMSTDDPSLHCWPSSGGRGWEEGILN